MAETILTRLIEYNNWANLRVLDACETLKAEQLDFQPQSAERFKTLARNVEVAESTS